MAIQENNKLQMFEDQPIRTAWDEDQEEWFFSVVDVVGVLTDSADYNTGRKYWNKLKQRLKEEGNELVTSCHQLKMKAADIRSVQRCPEGECIQRTCNTSWDIRITRSL